MRIVLCVVLAAACGKGDPPAPRIDPAGAAAHAAALDQLTVTSDGKRVVMARAFIKRVSPDQWRILVGDLEGSCDELLSGVTQRQPGGTSFVASIARRIQPDGRDAQVVTDFWSAGHATDAGAATARVTGSADRGGRAEVELGRIVDADKARKLEVAGAFTAVGCGDQAAPTEGLPKAPHPSTASATIAGQRVHLFSATRRGDAIVLSSGPRDCSPPTVPAQATIEHRAGRWQLTGTWFAAPSETADRALPEDKTRDLRITPGARGTGADGATVVLALAGRGTLGDYPVQLDGTIEAIDCGK